MKSKLIGMEISKKKMSLLEYYKLLLSKVSFNRELLHKEYQKGLKYLSLDEQAELNWWLNFNQKNNWFDKTAKS
ncbi:hypothetical protein [Ekhidna sp.]|uniref:hypothetical protein n=1 Tax=Ekhidna sp. TaxID=2608089 RepID=UPI0032992769